MISLTLDQTRLFLHVLAATIWVGGQLTLAGLVPALRRVSPEATKAAANAYNKVAWPAFGVLVATGVWNMVAEHDKIHGSYRGTLNVKLALVVLSGVAAYVHTRATTPRGRGIWGGLTAVSALGALLFGVQLGS